MISPWRSPRISIRSLARFSLFDMGTGGRPAEALRFGEGRVGLPTLVSAPKGCEIRDLRLSVQLQGGGLIKHVLRPCGGFVAHHFLFLRHGAGDHGNVPGSALTVVHR